MAGLQLVFLFSSHCFTVVPVNNTNCIWVMEHSLFDGINSSHVWVKSPCLEAVGSLQICFVSWERLTKEKAGWFLPILFSRFNL